MANPTELLLMASLGFLGSFGHCLGMCGPLTVAFSLSADPAQGQPPLRFHLALNLGRLVSYLLMGAAIGGLGSVLVAGGQVAGVGSDLRRLVALVTGLLLIGFGLRQVSPGLLPPLAHPLSGLHQRLNGSMARLASGRGWWTPAGLGLLWGLVPCGFLYAAQLKAAATTDLVAGALTMLAFGLGTLPLMMGLGVGTRWLSHDQRGQLYRLGGWITLIIGIITLLRTGDAMTDYAGYGALGLLMLALVARPLSRLWPGPLQYRRGLGVGCGVLALVHTVQMVSHTWGGDLTAVLFMLPRHQWGVGLGGLALALLLPLTATSSAAAQRRLGPGWRRLHLLSVPGLVLGAGHCLLLGSRYLGSSVQTLTQIGATGLLVGAVGAVLLVRQRWAWRGLGLERFYVGPRPQPEALPDLGDCHGKTGT